MGPPGQRREYFDSGARICAFIESCRNGVGLRGAERAHGQSSLRSGTIAANRSGENGRRRDVMGDKGKKDKDKGQRQKRSEQEQKTKQQLAKQAARTPGSKA